MRNARFIIAAGLALLLAAAPTAASDRDTKVRNDRIEVDAVGEWIYNDLDAGIAEAKETNRPLLIVIRCVT